MVSFYNKNVLITGACNVSKEVAIAFAKERANIAIFHKDKEELLTLERDLGNMHVRNYGYKCDLSQKHEIELALFNFKKQFDNADILFLNIDLHSGQDILDISVEEMEKEIEVSVNGTISLVKYFLPEMVKKQKGSIAFVMEMNKELSPIGLASLGAIERFNQALNAYFNKLGLKEVSASLFYLNNHEKNTNAENIIKAISKEKNVVKL